MRVPVMVVAITLCLAIPTKASPITLEVLGVITTSYMFPTGTPPAGWTPAPIPAVGSAFTLWYTFASTPVLGETLPIVTYTLGAFSGVSPCNGCIAAALNPLSAVELSLYGGGIFPRAGPPGLQTTLFSATLNAGWQSGSFSTYIETAVETGGVSGTITSARLVHHRVPEPATALLLSLGVFGVALRRRRTQRSLEPQHSDLHRTLDAVP